MEIVFVKNCVRRVENVSSNVVVANRVTSSGKKTQVNLRNIPGYEGYYADVERGIIYGRQGSPVGSKRKDGRVVVNMRNSENKLTTCLRSRLIASAALGRALERNEDVDHVNNLVHDDRLSNLNVCDRKSNMNNSLTRTLMKNNVKKRNTSEQIELTGAVSRSQRTYRVEKAK